MQNKKGKYNLLDFRFLKSFNTYNGRFNITLVIFFVVFLNSFNIYSQSELIKEIEGLPPTKYYEKYKNAKTLFVQRNYEESSNLFRELVDAYPFDGETWYFLGVSLYQEGQFLESGQAFEKVDELGIRPYAYDAGTGLNMYTAPFPRWAAHAFIQAGKPELAMDWIEKAIRKYKLENPNNLLSSPAFTDLRDNPRFKELVGSVLPESENRVEKWREDLEYLLAQLKIYNPVYENNLPNRLTDAAEVLKSKIPDLTDGEIVVELQHLLSLLEHSHNTFYFHFGEYEGEKVSFSRLPFTFYIFPEGLYIVDASKPYEKFIGSRVILFDKTSADEAIEKTKYLKDRENEMEINQVAPEYLVIPEVLHALKLTENPEKVTLTVMDSLGDIKEIVPQPIQFKENNRRMQPSRVSSNPPPLYLSRPDDSFWFENIDDETLYVQFNRVGHTDEENLFQFGLRLREYLKENSFSNLIIDVRRNNGGNTYFYKELLRTLISFDTEEDTNLYVLTARKTFSAAQNFITEVDRLTTAIFAGELSGGKPITVGGDSIDLTLPNSGMRFGISSVVWQLTSPRDTRLWIAPEIPVTLTAKDYFLNHDPVMEQILTRINKQIKDKEQFPEGTQINNN